MNLCWEFKTSFSAFSLIATLCISEKRTEKEMWMHMNPRPERAIGLFNCVYRYTEVSSGILNETYYYSDQDFHQD